MFYGWYDADINAKGVSQAEELREAFTSGFTEPWQLAEYFDLPQRDIESALHYWTVCRGIDFNK